MSYSPPMTRPQIGIPLPPGIPPPQYAGFAPPVPPGTDPPHLDQLCVYSSPASGHATPGLLVKYLVKSLHRLSKLGVLLDAQLVKTTNSRWPPHQTDLKTLNWLKRSQICRNVPKTAPFARILSPNWSSKTFHLIPSVSKISHEWSFQEIIARRVSTAEKPA